MRICFKKIAVIALIGLMGCQTSPSESERPTAYDHIAYSDKAVLTSPNDPRTYEAFTLDNGLRVLLVSDPKADDAAVTLDVHVGSFDDPSDRLGLAHFTEHMLFIGTEKYPEAGSYHQYIESAGGHSNAYTAGEDTVYFFSVKPYAFETALDRFSQFFVGPTFEPTYVERERNAVDAEYHMRFKDDNFRVHAVETRTANPLHPGHRFHAGNSDTLSDSKGPVHEDLLAFYEKYYSADKMTLTIVTSHSIDEQKQMVVERFSAVPARQHEKQLKPLLLEAEQLGKDITIKPNQKIQRLELTFPNTLTRDYETKPMLYVSEIINSASPESLKTFLKEKEWITDLHAAYGDITDEQNAFSISFSLTNEGVQKIDDITSATFAYIQFIKDEGVQEWVFDEIKAAHVRAFTFEEYTSAPTWSRVLATAMQKHPTEQIIANSYIGKEAVFSPEKINAVLDTINPTNLRRTIVAQSVNTNQVEPYFDVPYAVTPIAQDKLNAWGEIELSDYKFALDSPNPYLPKQFDMVDSSVDKVPSRLEIEGMHAWYQGNPSFQMPKVSTTIGFWTPVAHQTSRESLMTQLFVALLAEEMETQMRHVGKAGASGGISGSPRGLVLSLSSFTDRHDKVCQLFVDTLLDLGVNDEDRFESIKEAHRRAFESYHDAPPFVLASTALEKQILIPSWTPDELLPHLDDITLEAVREHGKALLATAQVEAYVHGNMSKSMAKTHLQKLSEQLTQIPSFPVNPLWKPVVKVFEPGTQVLDHVVSTSEDQMVMLNLLAEGPNLDEYLHIALLSRMMGAEFFTQLRTEEQLGYVVHLGIGATMGVPRMTLLVQSPEQSEAALSERVNQFIVEQSDALLSQESFDQAQQSIMADLLEPFKTLGAQQQFIWSEIALGRFSFELKSQMLEVLQSITLEDTKHYFTSQLSNPSLRRAVQITTMPKSEYKKELVPAA